MIVQRKDTVQEIDIDTLAAAWYPVIVTQLIHAEVLAVVVHNRGHDARGGGSCLRNRPGKQAQPSNGETSEASFSRTAYYASSK